jgi:hypothetical protein
MKRLLLLTFTLIFTSGLFGQMRFNEKPSSTYFGRTTQGFQTFSPLSIDNIEESENELKKRKKKKKKKGKKGKDEAYAMGKSYITAGYGVGNLAKTVFKIYQSYEGYSTKFAGPFNLKYEYGLTEKWGIGISLSYMSYDVSWGGTTYDFDNDTTINIKEGFKGSTFRILPKFNYHFGGNDKFDPYFGFGVGFAARSYKFYSNDPFTQALELKGIPISSELTLGMRYYFSPNIGIFTELGTGSAIFQFGLALKF